MRKFAEFTLYKLALLMAMIVVATVSHVAPDFYGNHCEDVWLCINIAWLLEP